jgi:hypothetical protein
VTRPVVQLQDHAHLAGRITGTTGDVPPPVTKHALPLNNGLIVPAEIPEPLIDRMSVQSIQFHDGVPFRIAHIAVPPTTSGVHLCRVPLTSRQPMCSLDVPGVPKFKRRGDTVRCLGQDFPQQHPPPVPRSPRKSRTQPTHCRCPALNSLQDHSQRPLQIDLAVGDVQCRVLDPGSRRCR